MNDEYAVVILFSQVSYKNKWHFSYIHLHSKLI